MSQLLAEGLLGCFDRLVLRLRPTGSGLLEWLREIARPPPGVELRAADGSQYTGLAMFERNRVIVMIAVANGHTTPAPQAIPLGPSSSSSYGSQSGRRLFDPEDDPGDGWPPNDPYLHRR